jgi:hypothetical protein
MSHILPSFFFSLPDITNCINWGVSWSMMVFTLDRPWTTLEEDYIAFLFPAQNVPIVINKF